MIAWLLASIAAVCAIAYPAYGGAHKAFYTAASPIHGTGAFVARSFQQGAVITVGISLLENITDDVSPWVNHCGVNPSAVLESDPAQIAVYGTVWLMATRDLQRGDEITVDYNQPVMFTLPAVLTTDGAGGAAPTVYTVKGTLEPPGNDYVTC